LYIADLTTSPAEEQPLVGVSSLRPRLELVPVDRQADHRPIAFSNHDGVYLLSGTNLTLLRNTASMVHPPSYPNCRYPAVDVGQNPQVSSDHVTAPNATSFSRVCGSRRAKRHCQRVCCS
jgi:hypothetical protein